MEHKIAVYPKHRVLFPQYFDAILTEMDRHWPLKQDGWIDNFPIDEVFRLLKDTITDLESKIPEDVLNINKDQREDILTQMVDVGAVLAMLHIRGTDPQDRKHTGIIVETKKGLFTYPEANSWVVTITETLILYDIHGDILAEISDFISVRRPQTVVEFKELDIPPSKSGEFEDVVETKSMEHGPAPDGFIMHNIYQKNIIVKRKSMEKENENQ